jgi:predicted nuclease of predicted toxin-antitoxin system
MEWAKQNDYVVFTHDLDFGTLLASTQSNAPSVIQVRTQDTFPDAIANIVIAALSQFESELKDGALITIDDSKSRVRILPISRSK